MPLPQLLKTKLTTSPATFLMALTFANYFGFAVWTALLNNFARDQAGFTGWDIGLLQSVREIPGLMAFTAIALFMIMREQMLAYASVVMLGAGIALTGLFPTLPGMLVTTMIMSIGFHYYETANQSLALQLLPRAQAPRLMGRIASAGAAAQLLAYGSVMLAWLAFEPHYATAYAVAGAICIALTLAAALVFPRFDGPTIQRRGIVLKRRYWLYYALTFMAGARRQVFVAFAGFLLVERFGFSVAQVASLLLVTCALNMVLATYLGALVGAIGERRTIFLENTVLLIVFTGYATIDDGRVAAGLYILDGVFYTLMIAHRTYFQKIADPEDFAPTAAIAFTINHILAVGIPLGFGLIWLINPSAVFGIGALIATTSLILSFFVPHDPDKGRETVLSRPTSLAVAGK